MIAPRSRLQNTSQSCSYAFSTSTNHQVGPNHQVKPCPNVCKLICVLTQAIMSRSWLRLSNNFYHGSFTRARARVRSIVQHHFSLSDNDDESLCSISFRFLPCLYWFDTLPICYCIPINLLCLQTFLQNFSTCFHVFLVFLRFFCSYVFRFLSSAHGCFSFSVIYFILVLFS